MDLPFTANNHLLNSVLAKISMSAFGSSELALRLPNVVAFPAYLFFGWLLLRRMARPPIALAGFVLLTASVFLLDFFSLCRGYGLALALLVAGTYFLVRGLGADATRGRDFAAGGLALAFGATAFYGLLPVLWSALFGVAFGVRMGRRRSGDGATAARSLALDLAVPVALAAVTTALLAPILSFFEHNGELWYGGKSGFWRDTVGSLITVTLNETSPPGRLHAAVNLLVLSVVVFIVSTVVVAAIRGGSGPFLFAAYLVAAQFAFAEAARGLSRTPFPKDRTALAMVPLFWVAVAGAAEVVFEKGGRIGRSVVAPIGVLLVASAVVLFAREANLDRTVLWKFESDTPAMLGDLARIRASLPANTPPLHLGLDWRLVPTVEYYRLTRGLSWLAHVTQENPWDPRNEFVFLLRFERGEIAPHGAHLLRVYSRTGNVLAAAKP